VHDFTIQITERGNICRLTYKSKYQIAARVRVEKKKETEMEEKSVLNPSNLRIRVSSAYYKRNEIPRGTDLLQYRPRNFTSHVKSASRAMYSQFNFLTAFLSTHQPS